MTLQYDTQRNANMYLTEDEILILTKTAELYNLISALPNKHPSFVDETILDIHRIQQRIMSRLAVRMYPEIFNKPQ